MTALNSLHIGMSLSELGWATLNGEINKNNSVRAGVNRDMIIWKEPRSPE